MTRLLAAMSSLLLLACPVDLKFTQGAVESLPQEAVASSALTSGKSITTQVQLAGFFKQECHMYPQANFCPAGVDAKAKNGQNDFKFTSTSLLGLVFHAEMYGGGMPASCAGAPATITSASFVAATEAGSDPDRFILDTLAQYECLEPSDDGFRVTSLETDHQATLTARYKFGDGQETNVFQVDVSVDQAKTPTFLAFNWAGVSSMAARAVLLVNLKTHRFAVKYLTAPVPSMNIGTNWVDAVGVGGVDRATGARHAGYYHVRYTSERFEPMVSCVDNATQLLELDDTECAAAGVPITWTSSDAVATWLGMTPAERTRLAPFLAKFATPEPLALSDTPSGRGDAELYFPKVIK